MPNVEIDTRRARESFSDTLNRVAYGKERVVLTRRGRRIAVLAPVEDIERLEELEALQDAEMGRKALAEFKRSGAKAVPWEEVDRKSRKLRRA